MDYFEYYDFEADEFDDERVDEEMPEKEDRVIARKRRKSDIFHKKRDAVTNAILARRLTPKRKAGVNSKLKKAAAKAVRAYGEPLNNGDYKKVYVI